jgi:hypothetical protein
LCTFNRFSSISLLSRQAPGPQPFRAVVGRDQLTDFETYKQPIHIPDTCIRRWPSSSSGTTLSRLGKQHKKANFEYDGQTLPVVDDAGFFSSIDDSTCILYIHRWATSHYSYMYYPFYLPKCNLLSMVSLCSVDHSSWFDVQIIFCCKYFTSSCLSLTDIVSPAYSSRARSITISTSTFVDSEDLPLNLSRETL